jgi:hypothetical protein
MTQMNKKIRQEQGRQEDQALVRGMLWVVGAIVLEGLLFVLNRYAFNYNTTLESVLLAEKLRMVLKVLRIVGLVAFVGGAGMAVMQLKKERNTLWAGVVSMTGFAVSLCAHVAFLYQDSGVRMLYLLVPVLGGLALCYYIYPRDFFLCALPAVAAALGLWFVRAGGVGLNVILTLLICAAALMVVLMLKKNGGKLDLAGKSVQIMEEKTGYTLPMASAVAALAVQVLAAVAGGTVAYYLVFAVGAWLFAMLVYYTVKMM